MNMGVGDSVESSRIALLSTYTCFLVVGFCAGYSFSHVWKEPTRELKSCLSSEPMYLQKENHDGTSSKEWAVGNDQSLESLSARQYSCNSLAAFEKLTHLHHQTIYLEDRQKRGESNRARTATIIRKAGQARAAESAYRDCVSSMMPELLDLWDEKAKHGQVNTGGWSEKNEKEVTNGITMKELNSMADMLDASET